MSSDKIKAMMIFEVIGRPPEHLTETLNQIIDAVSKEKGVKITERKVNEAVLMKDQKDFYTNFAEIEVEIEELFHLIMLMFKYMPTHVDVIEPENLKLTNNNLNEVLNELGRKLHQYDEVARILQIEKSVLEKKLREVLPKENKKSD